MNSKLQPWQRTSLAMAAIWCAQAMAQSTMAPAVAEPVAVFAAGSLREVLTEIARNYKGATGQKLALRFGASGLLRESIEKGEPTASWPAMALRLSSARTTRTRPCVTPTAHC